MQEVKGCSRFVPNPQVAINPMLNVVISHFIWMHYSTVIILPYVWSVSKAEDDCMSQFVCSGSIGDVRQSSRNVSCSSDSGRIATVKKKIFIGEFLNKRSYLEMVHNMRIEGSLDVSSKPQQLSAHRSQL